jgi:hypothetical protein
MGIDATAEWREAPRGLPVSRGRPVGREHQGPARSRRAAGAHRQPPAPIRAPSHQRAAPIQALRHRQPGGRLERRATAEVLQGIIRNIEYTSNADAAYASGGESAATTGLGYWDVCAEYEDERSLSSSGSSSAASTNPLSVVMDPGAKELAGDDARWCIISTDISKADGKASYPDKEMPKGGNWGGRATLRRNGWPRTASASTSTATSRRSPTSSRRARGALPGMRTTGQKRVLEELLHRGGSRPSARPKYTHPSLRSSTQGAETRETTRRKACWAKIAGDEVVGRASSPAATCSSSASSAPSSTSMGPPFTRASSATPRTRSGCSTTS